MSDHNASNFLPAVVRAVYRGEQKIHLRFNDGLEATVDLADLVQEGPIFAPLSDPAYFQRFFVEAGALTWPNGADIAPETLYKRAKSGVAA